MCTVRICVVRMSCLPIHVSISWGQKWLLFAMAVDICSVMVQMVSLADRAAIPSQTHRDTSGALELYGISAALKA